MHNFSVYDCEKLPTELLADRYQTLLSPVCMKRFKKVIDTLGLYLPKKEIMTSPRRLESNQTLSSKYTAQSQVMFVKMLLGCRRRGSLKDCNFALYVFKVHRFNLEIMARK